ncbi:MULTISPECIES: hypothetical protein [unclassified Xanthomonas]|uniref:hypothetical protein n=1 Tax=Xanthomonas sp. LMG 8992 TaxID=1591157 RepID=UPI001F37AAF1|nr:hypothetical protein [Xanthomonas sp. LMG 8992]
MLAWLAFLALIFLAYHSTSYSAAMTTFHFFDDGNRMRYLHRLRNACMPPDAGYMPTS